MQSLETGPAGRAGFAREQEKPGSLAREAEHEACSWLSTPIRHIG